MFNNTAQPTAFSPFAHLPSCHKFGQLSNILISQWQKSNNMKIHGKGRAVHAASILPAMTCAWTRLHPVIIGELLFHCWQAVTRNHFIACPFLLLLLPRHSVSGFRPTKCACMHNDASISSIFLTCTCVKPGGQERTKFLDPSPFLPWQGPCAG